MRRAAPLAAVVLVALLGVAAPALAQERDPFDPLVDPAADGGVDGAGDGGGGDGDGAADDDGAADRGATDGDATAPGDELPNTGADPVPWLVLAYALIAAGAGALVLARVLAPRAP